MARTAITSLNAAVRNGNSLHAAYQATDSTNGMSLKLDRDDKQFISVKNGSGASINVTIKERVATAAGDLIVAVAAGAEQIIGPFDSRFKQTDETVWINLSASASVTITAHRLP